MLLYLDKVPPVLGLCPADQETQTYPGKPTKMVEYQTPSATENSNETPSVECSPSSGFDFPIGETKVTCVARDSSGNNQTCDFQVNVRGKLYNTII